MYILMHEAKAKLKNSFNFSAIIALTLIIALMISIISSEMSMSTSVTTYAQQNQVNDTNSITDSNNNKIVIITFGDTHTSQFSAAKPILDKYGFKASFFITCTYANDQNKTRHPSWTDILALQEDAQDIESKGILQSI
jgi:Polysaccharide deacetylase